MPLIYVPHPDELVRLSQSITEHSRDKEFVPTTFDTLPYRLASLQDEFFELECAIEMSRICETTATSHDPDAVFHEIADVGIYTILMLSDLGETNWTFRRSYGQGTSQWSSSSEITKQLRREWSSVFRAWRKGNRRDVMLGLELLFVSACHVNDVCLQSYCNLEARMWKKLEVLILRQPTHGGKDPRT